MSARHPHRPRKRFGQHFLHDPDVRGRIVAAIQPSPGEHLVEIGPGLGALTRPLLQATGTLDVIEIDRDLIPLLKRELGTLGHLRIHHGDALQFDFNALATRAEKLRVVGNLPYNISTPLIFHLLTQHHITDMHFMLQQEVVERITATPGGKSYGRLSVMVQYHCRAEKLFTVPPDAFNPPPQVHSAIVRLTPWPHPLLQATEPSHFRHLVNQAFSQRRKTLRNALKGLLDHTTIAALGIDPKRRPETVTLEEFVRLADASTELIHRSH